MVQNGGMVGKEAGSPCTEAPSMSKAHISLRKKLAAALRCQLVEVDGKLVPAIPYEDAKKMTDEQVISLFQFDHGIQEGIGGPTVHWNLTPRFIGDHRRKTAKLDIPQIHKTKRLTEAHEAFQARVLAKSSPDATPDEHPKRKSKIPSRPFSRLPPGKKRPWSRRTLIKT